MAVTVYDTKLNGVNFKVTKVDGEDKALTGAAFTLKKATVTDGVYAEDSSDTKNYISGTDSVFTSDVFAEAGAYILTEATVPSGYQGEGPWIAVVGSDLTVKLYKATSDMKLGDEVSLDSTDKTYHLVNTRVIELKVKKTDLDGKDVDGAKLKVTYQKDGTTVTVDEWTSDSTTEPNGHDIGSKLEIGVTYTMTEVSAPNGFLVRTDFTFVVNEDGTVTVTDTKTDGKATYNNGVLTVKDEDFSVLVKKIDGSAEGGPDLAGAVLALYKSDGTTPVTDKDGNAATWTSQKNAVWEISDLVAVGGTYVLKETTTPEGGYITVDPVTFTVKDDGSLELITEGDDGTKKETDSTDDAYIGGTYSDAIIVINRKSPETTGYFYVQKNIDGTGYPADSTFTFTLTPDTEGAPMPDGTANGVKTITVTGGNSETFGDIVFTKSGTYVYKVTENTTSKLPGFIYDTTEHTVQFVVSMSGKTMSHSMSIDGKAGGNILNITNKYVPVKIKKVNANGTALSGAQFALYQADGTTAVTTKDAEGNETPVTWTSNGSDWDITQYVTFGSTYVLKETSAPANYVPAGDITFKVNDDGSVTLAEGTKGASYANNTITVTNEDGTSVTVSKKWVDANGDTITWPSTIEVSSVQVQLYQGETAYGEAVSLTSGSTSYTWNNLPKKDSNGNEYTYTVQEVSVTSGDVTTVQTVTDSDGNTYSYVDADCGNRYFVTYDTATAGTVTVTNTEWHLQVLKTDTNNNKLNGAQFSLYYYDSTQTDGIGDPVKNGTWTSNSVDATEDISKLVVPGTTYILMETSAPKGYTFVDNIQFTVNTDGTVTLADTTRTDVAVSTSNNTITITVKDSSFTVKLVKVDQFGNKVEGAWLRLYEGNQKLHWENWRTKEANPKDASGCLQAGKTYTLSEMRAPTGYKKLSGDFTFTVGKDGNLTWDATAKPDEVTVTKGDDGVWQISVVNTEATTYSVEKVWNDSAAESSRPASVTVQLYADGTAVNGKTLTLNEENDWSGTWSDLPKYTATSTAENKVEVVYTAREVKVGDTTVAKDATSVTVGQDTYTITNTDANGKTTITNTKLSSLVITKTVSGVTLTDEEKAAITFTVTGPNSYNATNTYDKFVDGKWTLTDLAAGEYTVTESGADKAGYTLNTTYKVGDVETTTAATATIAAGEAATVDVTNTYVGKSGSAEVKAQKKYNGWLTDGAAETFTFKLTADSSNSDAPMPATTELTVSKPTTGDTADFSFGTISFGPANADQTYYYTIEEVIPETKDTAISYATAKVDVRIYVSNDLAATVKYKYTEDQSYTDGVKQFVNIRKAGFDLKKTDDQGNALAGVTFTLYKDADCTQTAEYITADATTDADGKATFSGLSANTTYYLKETSLGTANEGKYKMDSTVYTVIVAADGRTVTVKKGDTTVNPTDGLYTFVNKELTEVSGTKTWVDGGETHDNATEITLTLYQDDAKVEDATPTWDGNTCKFTGLEKYDEDGEAYTYTVKETPISGYSSRQSGNNFTNIELTSVTVSKAWKNEDGSTTWPDDVKTVTVQVYGGTQSPTTVTLSSTDSSATVDGLLKYAEDGTEITYTVQENDILTKADKHETVTDGIVQVGDNTYTVSVSGYTVTNTYKQPDAASLTIPVTKTMKTGSDTIPDDTEFAFRLQKLGADHKPVGDPLQTIRISKSEMTNGTATKSFDAITFDAAGEYLYAVTEMPGELEGMTYDKESKTVYITVTKNATTNKLEAEITKVTEGITPEVTELGKVITFTNEYHVPKTDVTVTKAWANLANSKTWPDDVKAVTVQLYADGKQVQTVDLSSDKTSETITDLNKYKADGTTLIAYTVQETDVLKTDDTHVAVLGEDNVMVNGNSYTITVSGTTVTNTYVAPDSVDVVIPVTKAKAEGSDAFPDGASFTFKMTQPSSQSFTLPENVTIEGTGTKDFGKITFTEAGTYTFYVEEVVGSLSGMTYDSAKFTVTVKVTNTVANKLTADTTFAKGEASAEDVEFTNSYDQPEIDVTVTKTWEGIGTGKTWPSDVASVTVALYADDVDTGKTVTLTSSTTSAKFTGLPKYKDDGTTLIAYTVKETTITTTAGDLVTVSGDTVTVGENTYAVGIDGSNITNKTTCISISKTEINGSEELPGATLKILDADGTVVRSWTSGTAAQEIVGLKTGVTYTLRETIAPDGYTVTSDSTFSIAADGTVTYTGTTTTDGVLLVEDAPTTVSISKTDITGEEELAGAKLQIIGPNGETVKEWTSSKEGPEVITKLKTGVTYTLRETTAPDGYTVTADSTFSIAADGTVTYSGTTTTAGVLLVEDAPTKVSISKTDITGEEELEGAKLQIITKDADGEETVVEEWTSTTSPKTITKLKTGVEYILRETTAPDGYAVTADSTFSIDEKGKVTYSGTTTTDGVLLVEDAPTKVKISKVDVTNEKELPGATLQLIGPDGNIVKEWESGDEPEEIEGLTTGIEYTLREIVAPDGYTVTTDTHFTLTPDGKVDSEKTTTTQNADGILLVEDWPTTVSISKTDVTGEKELAGAKLQIIDAAGTVVTSWTSTTSPKTITKLKVGTYTLRETTAPDGYTVTADSTFSIDEKGKVTYSGTTSTAGVLLVEDEPTRVKISKVDVTNEKELPGATLQIIDPNGKVVKQWKSGSEPKEIVGLTTGIEYTLREIVAPDGYTVTTDTHFTLTPEGKVDSSKTTTTQNADGILLVEDWPTSVKIDKTDITNGTELSGATLQIIDPNGKVVKEWTSTGKPVTITGLTTGVTYTLRETIAPYGYAIATDTTFSLKADGTVDADKTTAGMKNGVILVEDWPATVTHYVTKVWQDSNNYARQRPTSITVQLYAGSYTCGDPVVLNAANGWSHTWEWLPKYSGGYEVPYTVKEISVYADYEVSYTETDSEHTVITNTYTVVTPTPDGTPTPTPTATPEETPTPTPTATITPEPTATPTPIPGMPYNVRNIDGEWYYIDDNGVPLGIFPGTGDDSNTTLWAVSGCALLACGLALAVILLRRKKRKA